MSDEPWHIWHNARCSKSRETLGLLEERGIAPRIRSYLDSPPTEAELRDVLARLGISARALLRDKEPLAKELGLADAGDGEILAAMVAHPILIERPVVIHGDRAVIGRPPERVLDLLGG